LRSGFQLCPRAETLNITANAASAPDTFVFTFLSSSVFARMRALMDAGSKLHRDARSSASFS
jgi:hypothetical protein